MSGLAEAALGLGYGLASALVPVINAEAYAVVAGHRGDHALVAVLALSLGQTAGKLILFESARRGSGRLARKLGKQSRPGRTAARAARWTGPIRRWLSHRRTALPTVLVSAAVGVPPLALVSFAAGTAGLRHWEFAVACLLGRVIRFAALVLPATVT
ncbi:VTT domain-containing protein [Micromonospora sp. NPDC000663]|uniref:VTT domain-containing protein n=1 Tax=Micromonospora sp. NPDC000663 TaxID=3364218 RepID=UPI0036B7C60C